jgi:DNA polymerase-1
MLGQSEPYPSLNGVGDHYKLGVKSNDLEEEYYSKRIDTNEIPLEVLLPYLEQDLTLTAKCYEAQMACLKDNPAMLRLIRLTCIDLLILEEMEWNGLPLDVQECDAKATEIRVRIAELDAQLGVFVDGYALNWNSGDQLSVVLYGGKLKYFTKEQDGVFKTGKKAGQTKFRAVEHEQAFPRLVSPIKGSELAKHGFFSTDETTLRSLKATGKARKIIEILLERAKLERLVSGYYEGLPKQIRAMGWEGNTVHGTLNQCVASTGRLSSSKPNLQNQPPEINILFRSRYA